MREDEIDDILECIGKAWKAQPHLRLGQIIANAADSLPNLQGRCECDPFYIPDWKLVEVVECVCGVRDYATLK